MDELSRLAGRPYAFIFRYVRRRALSHAVIVAAVLGRGRLFHHDAIRREISRRRADGRRTAHAVWFAFALLVSLIAADNILWRLAGWIASFSFVRVTGDLRRDLFRHLTGHSPTISQTACPAC